MSIWMLLRIRRHNQPRVEERRRSMSTECQALAELLIDIAGSPARSNLARIRVLSESSEQSAGYWLWNPLVRNVENKKS